MSPAISRHLILWTIALFVLVAIIWAKQAVLDEVTRASGKVIPSRQVQIIQNLEGGILAALLVKEGDVVEAQQILLHIDDTRFQADWQQKQLQKQSLQTRLLRLEAEASGQTWTQTSGVVSEQADFWQTEYALYQARANEQQAQQQVLQAQQQQQQQTLNRLQARYKQLKRSALLAQKELNITQPLVKQGVMSELELLKLQRQVNDLKGEQDNVGLDIPRVKASLNEAKQKKRQQSAQFKAQAQQQLSDTRSQLAVLVAGQQSHADRLKRTTVRAPLKGIIKRLKVNTVGGVLQPGMDLVEIVPLDDQLLIEAKVKPADIAFLYPGLTAKIKFSAYDFAIFGGLSAKLTHISADSIQDSDGQAYFLIRLRTQQNFLQHKTAKQNLPILAGMTVQVDMLMGQKTVLDYILKPIQRIRDKALREP